MRFRIIANRGHYFDSGVNKKISQQVASLNRVGVKTDLVWVDIDGSVGDTKKDSITGRKGRTRLNRRLSYERKMSKLLRSEQSEDVIYFRYPYTPIYFPLLFFRGLRKGKIVLEYNSIVSMEIRVREKGLSSWAAQLWEAIFGDFVVKNIDGIVGVTEEITDYYASKAGFRTKHVTIENGIDVNGVRLRTPPSFDGQILNLLVVANISTWHGVDRLIDGMAGYSGDVETQLHIVGDGAAKDELLEKTKKLGLELKIHFHGFVRGSELDSFFDRCHIAIGPLGLHRKSLKEATPLKAREFCARGIPFITAYHDPDFSPNFPYIYEFPLDDSPVDVHRIIEFARTAYGDPNGHSWMRDYALKNLDWDVKMEKLKGFLRDL